MASSRKQVLEEDAYVEALDAIIERDFFPDLPKLKYQTMYLDAVATKNPALIEQVRQYIASDQKKRPQARASSSTRHGTAKRPRHEDSASAWDMPTPPREASDVTSPNNSASGAESQEVSGAAPPATATMTLNHFLATHTSEDNAAFEELQDKAVEAHKKKYHWAFDDDHANTHLRLLPDGTMMTKDRRLLMDKACDTKLALEDARPAGPETWTFRARNQLLFPPDMETSRAICKVPQSESSVLLLEGGKSTSQQLAVKSRTGAVTKKPMETVYSNSRFSDAFLSLQDVIPDEAPAPALDLVEMTPLIVPGEHNASPLMTWGAIAATPMILKSDAPTGGPSFQIKEASRREKLALEMDAKNKQRMKAKKTPTPFRGTPAHGRATPTPHLSIFRAGAFSELRASYSTPLVQSGKAKRPKK
ncbi:hypothetical protein ACHHYP_01404 [Achlya hypogyna]|uniref:Protein DGCR14 n=1 Tax=Achlya hypogyna TaxID=1202772 RepID=A0A1V9Z968_ACHHY|nr:hypothetical protein ACHHYP_01404 [Achlya hypogyna]